ncbi:MAG: hypothetical protein ACR2OE_04640 [Thermomicrobiales bacterium]
MTHRRIYLRVSAIVTLPTISPTTASIKSHQTVAPPIAAAMTMPVPASSTSPVRFLGVHRLTVPALGAWDLTSSDSVGKVSGIRTA